MRNQGVVVVFEGKVGISESQSCAGYKQLCLISDKASFSTHPPVYMHSDYQNLITQLDKPSQPVNHLDLDTNMFRISAASYDVDTPDYGQRQPGFGYRDRVQHTGRVHALRVHSTSTLDDRLTPELGW